MILNNHSDRYLASKGGKIEAKEDVNVLELQTLIAKALDYLASPYFPHPSPDKVDKKDATRALKRALIIIGT